MKKNKLLIKNSDITSFRTVKSFIYELTYKNDYSPSDFYFHDVGELENIFKKPFPNERNLWKLNLKHGIDVIFIETLPVDSLIIEKINFAKEISFLYTIQGNSILSLIENSQEYTTNSNRILEISYPFKTTSLPENNLVSSYLIINFNLGSILNYLDNKLISVDLMNKIEKSLLNKDSIFLYSAFINDYFFEFINQIQKMPFDKKFRKIFTELKFLELIWITILDLLDNPVEQQKNFRLSLGDYEKLKKAKNILIENLEDPPSLTKLSRMIGLNEYKFKVGFRKVFGMPPYAFLQDYKLEIARNLLESGDLSVTEVASKIGYSNFSKFSSAFKRKFGNNPSKYLTR